jgi:hypothetical protein
MATSVGVELVLSLTEAKKPLATQLATYPAPVIVLAYVEEATLLVFILLVRFE